jgi:hypothetical protein
LVVAGHSGTSDGRIGGNGSIRSAESVRLR